MSPTTLATVLVAAVAHAVWNTAAKTKRGDTHLFVWAYTLASALLCLPVGVWTAVHGARPPTWSLAAGAAVSAVFHVAYSLVLQLGYDRSDLGVVYPVARGTGPLLTMVVAIAVLGERPGALSVLGAVVVLAGVAVVTGDPFRGRGRGRAAASPFLWGGATGVLIAGYTLWDSFSVTRLHLAPTTYFAATLVLETLLLSPRALAHRSGVRAALLLDRRPVVVVAVLSPLAYVLVLTALQTVPVAIVAPLRESSIVVGALLAWWVFGEPHLARRIAGAATVVVGIALISLA